MPSNGAPPSLDSVIRNLQARGIEVPSGNLRLDGYGDSPQLSAELIELIRAGKKQAGSSLRWSYDFDREALPKAGDIGIVLTHDHKPAVLTRVRSVTILPFDEVTAAYATLEGEGDLSLAYWRKVHWRYFSKECRRIAREPAKSMPVVCEIFEVLRSLREDSA